MTRFEQRLHPVPVDQTSGDVNGRNESPELSALRELERELEQKIEELKKQKRQLDDELGEIIRQLNSATMKHSECLKKIAILTVGKMETA